MWDYEWEVGGASKLRKGIQILLLGQKKDGPWHYTGGFVLFLTTKAPAFNFNVCRINVAKAQF